MNEERLLWGCMAKPKAANGKTRTHFEQIPVAVVAQIAVADVAVNQVPDRRKPSKSPPSPPGNES